MAPRRRSPARSGVNADPGRSEGIAGRGAPGIKPPGSGAAASRRGPGAGRGAGPLLELPDAVPDPGGLLEVKAFGGEPHLLLEVGEEQGEPVLPALPEPLHGEVPRRGLLARLQDRADLLADRLRDDPVLPVVLDLGGPAPVHL